MGRYERRTFFESLCEMREQYATRPVDDQPGSLLIEDAIIYAEAVMLALETEAPDFEELATEVAAGDPGISAPEQTQD